MLYYIAVDFFFLSSFTRIEFGFPFYFVANVSRFILNVIFTYLYYFNPKQVSILWTAINLWSFVYCKNIKIVLRMTIIGNKDCIWWAFLIWNAELYSSKCRIFFFFIIHLPLVPHVCSLLMHIRYSHYRITTMKRENCRSTKRDWIFR